MDLTPYLVPLFVVTLNIIGGVAVGLINSKMKKSQMRDLLSAALTNALGKIQVAGAAEITAAQVKIPGVSPAIAVGVQYVLDHAGEAAAHFGLTPESIADSILARIGVQNIETNKAIAASPSAEAPAPLAPVPATSNGKISVGTTLAGAPSGIGG